jgi:hypothetical protein
MGASLRLLSRVFLLASLLTTGGLIPGDNTPATTPERHDASVSAFPEVRLRKLHLVRPDLIPYPIAYEVVC